MSDTKVAVIGWDGASFGVLRPLLEAGALPNLQKLIADGAWGVLQSTIHPLSPTAWSSFMTGVNPGKHGIFDFIRLDQSGNFRLARGAQVKQKTLWGRLSETGWRVGVVNVPMTYPPEVVNGFVISGMDAPRLDRVFSHPPKLAKELQKEFGKYQVDINARGRPGESVDRFSARYVDALCRSVTQRTEAVNFLLRQYQPDFVAVVFTATDRVQHAYGHMMGAGVHPNSAIGRVYSTCDQALGELLHQMDGWSVLLMSDHGAGSYDRVFELGAWLIDKGWLAIQPSHKLPGLAEYLEPTQRRLNRLVQSLFFGQIVQPRFLGRIIWEKTKAFSLGAYGSIFVNSRDRFPQGVVKQGKEYDQICDEIEEGLLATRDPETGDAIVRAVYRAGNIYSGPYTCLAPDLLIETESRYFVRNPIDHFEQRIVYPAGRYHGRSLAHTGRHNGEGILVARGEPFSSGEMPQGAHITDLTPTILHLFGLPVPRSLDGEPLLSWMRASHRRSVRWTDSAQDDNESDKSDPRDVEMSDLEQRLRDLGYLG